LIRAGIRFESTNPEAQASVTASSAATWKSEVRKLEDYGTWRLGYWGTGGFGDLGTWGDLAQCITSSPCLPVTSSPRLPVSYYSLQLRYSLLVTCYLKGASLAPLPTTFLTTYCGCGMGCGMGVGTGCGMGVGTGCGIGSGTGSGVGGVGVGGAGGVSIMIKIFV
jgi:hypothetical protein